MGQPTRPRTRLETLLERLEREPETDTKEIDRLLERDPTAFQEGVVHLLRSDIGPRAIEFIVELLVSRGRLFDMLRRRSLTRDEAVEVARTAIRIDPKADLDLARRLAAEAPTLSSSAATRLLDVLGEVSDGKRLLPSLLLLLRASDARVRSKVVLMMARTNRSVDWARKRLADPDPRMRASAVEGLWGNPSGDALDLLKSAARDANNRVAANALYALYELDDEWTIAELLRMGNSDVPMFRASAAWAMGETADPRFAGALERMKDDPKDIVRRRAIAAQERMHRMESLPEKENSDAGKAQAEYHEVTR